jgi:hypothetical protein
MRSFEAESIIVSPLSLLILFKFSFPDVGLEITSSPVISGQGYCNTQDIYHTYTAADCRNCPLCCHFCVTLEQAYL